MYYPRIIDLQKDFVATPQPGAGADPRRTAPKLANRLRNAAAGGTGLYAKHRTSKTARGFPAMRVPHSDANGGCNAASVAFFCLVFF